MHVTPHPPPPALPAVIDHSWQAQLAAWLAAHRTYPEAARRGGEEGTPSLRFTVARDGRIESVSLVSGSGYALLDNAALDLLRGAQVPAFPPGMNVNRITVTISLQYSLTR